jgi:hypothetical protein
MIDGPKMPLRHDRILAECEHPIEGGFTDLVERAKLAGWNDFDVANALLTLARARILKIRDEYTPILSDILDTTRRH